MATTTQKRALLVIGALAVLLALGVGAFLATEDDDDEASTSTTAASSTTTTTGATTTSEASTTSTAPVDPADLDLAAFPELRSGVRFQEPQALVQAFATQLLGFDTDVVIGELQQGDARSGEITIAPRPGGPTTVVPVRQISDGSWVAVAADSGLIRLDAPEALTTLRSPQPLAGAATAFEGHVDVALFADGARPTPVATTFVTGSGGGTLGDFSGELRFEAPADASHGVLVLTAGGGEDGTTQYATAIRVRF
jgi:hypothetical protein